MSDAYFDLDAGAESPPVGAGDLPVFVPPFSWFPTIPPTAVLPSAGPVAEDAAGSWLDWGVTPDAALLGAGALVPGVVVGVGGVGLSQADRAISEITIRMQIGSSFMTFLMMNQSKFRLLCKVQWAWLDINISDMIERSTYLS